MKYKDKTFLFIGETSLFDKKLVQILLEKYNLKKLLHLVETN